MQKPRIWFNSVSQVSATGYGGAGNNFIMELQRRGYEIIPSNMLRYYLDHAIKLEYDDLPRELQPEIQIDFLQPYRSYENEFFFSPRIGNSMQIGKRRYLFTMFESKVLPWYADDEARPFEGKVPVVTWADDINDRYKYDALIVPSKWCADIFRENGVKCPIHVVPLGVNPNQFPYINRPYRDTFTILHQCFYVGDRKGGDIAKDAFLNLKDKGELKNAMFLIKFVPFMCKLKQDITLGKWKNLFMLSGSLTQGELLELIALADFSINPTSGEGFGLIPLEHMATGLAVAVSNNTGCQDYIEPDFNFPINCFEQPNWFKKIGGMEMRPDPEHVEQLLLHAYNNRAEIKEMGRRASQYVLENWTYEHATNKLLEVLNA